MENNKQNEQIKGSSIEINAATEQNAVVNEDNSVEIKSPIDFIKKDWRKLFDEHKERLLRLNFLQEYDIKIDENEFFLPSKNKFLLALFGMIVSIQFYFKDKILSLRKSANFNVSEVATAKYVYNDKSGMDNYEYCNLTLETDKGYKKSNIEIKGNAKSDFQKFQEALNLDDNHFQTMFNHREFKTFYENFILPKLENKTIITYENCGKIKPNTYLGSDFLIENGNIYRVNEDGLIPTSKENVFIKVNDKRSFRLPKLSNSNKSGQVVAKDFIQNILDSWGENYIHALLAIGHMIMGLFVERFTNKSTGTPVLILSGVSGSGKSTIIKNGISIFGFGDDLLLAGNSTVLGQQFVANKINGANVCVDDLSETVIESKGFGQTIKNQYNSTPRARRIEYGKNIFLEYPCSQIVYSTNSSLPEVDALENRVNLINIMKNYLDTDKYHYLTENTQNNEELSLILPELLKLDEEKIVEKHKELVEEIKGKIDGKIPRIAHNTAYMWCGIKLLEQIADIEIKDLKSEVIKYAQEAVERYKNIPNELDKLLNELLTLKEMEKIEEGKHYNIRKEGDRIHIMFHKGTLIKIYNDNFKEPNQKISKTVFNNWLKNDSRVINHKITGNYRGIRKTSIIVDITDIPDMEDFSGYTGVIKPDDKPNNNLPNVSAILYPNDEDIT